VKQRIHHEWRLSPKEARDLQKTLAGKVIQAPLTGPVSTVAGIDVGIRHGTATAAVVVLTYPHLKTIEQTVSTRPAEFPYIPGLLTFREGPVVLDTLEKLTALPDVMIFDGQGIAHPLRLGIASHIGILLDRPTIGCAKSRLCGTHAEPDPERGSHALLFDGDEAIGAVLRTRTNVKPLFVSPGHRIDISGSIRLVLRCCRRFRLPETTRLAHRLASEAH
jgi:deoxyribonuclease V